MLEWTREQKKLVLAFDRILEKRRKFRKNDIDGTFFTSSSYKSLTSTEPLEFHCSDEEETDHEETDSENEDDFESTLNKEESEKLEPMEIDSSVMNVESTELEHESLEMEHSFQSHGDAGKMGRPRKSLGAVSLRCLKSRTQNLFDLLRETCETEDIELGTLLGYLGRRYYLQQGEKYDHEKGELFNKIFHGNDPLDTKLTIEEGLYLQSTLNIGRRRYVDLSQFLKPHLRLPNTDVLRAKRNQLTPELETFCHGKWANLKEVVQIITKQTLEHLCNESSLKAKNYLTAVFTLGFDGSGRHSQFRSCKMPNDSENLILGGIRLISIMSDDLIYNEESLGCDTEFPFFIIPGKEGKDLVREIMKRIEDEAEACGRSIFGFSVAEKEIVLEVKIKMTQNDGKVLKTVSGLNGAFCLVCKASNDDGNNIEKVRKGFMPNRDIEATTYLYNLLVEEGRFEKSKSSVREGCTHEPMIRGYLNPHLHIPVLHARINSLKFFENLAYHFNAKSAFPDEKPIRGPGRHKTTDQTAAVKKAKEKFQNQAKNGPLNLPLDRPDSTGAGGNTDNGNHAKEFFNPLNRKNVLDLFDANEDERDSIEELLLRFNVILRILHCTKAIKTKEFEDFCNETYCQILEKFPWAKITMTLHKFLAHSAQIIYLNGGDGLGQESESPLESQHKHLRRVRMTLARMTSLDDNITDIFHRLFISSSPLIRKMKPKKRKSFGKQDKIYTDDDEVFETLLRTDDDVYFYNPLRES